MKDKLTDAYIIQGATALNGSLSINTAKNSALVLLLGALLSKEKVVLQDIPRLSDIFVMVDLLKHFGATVEWYGNDLHIQAETITNCSGPYHLVSKMRASFVGLGALLGRCREAGMAMPGGCTFGPRPVDRHIKAFQDLGAVITDEDGDFRIHLEKPLEGVAQFSAPTVGGTQNIILASVLGEGTVTIENAACEPEITDLVTMLSKMGAQISGKGSARLVIQGVKALKGITYRPIPDRIEAATFMLAAAATRGKVRLDKLNVDHLDAVISKLTDAGVRVEKHNQSSLSIDASTKLKPVSLVTSEYPGIATDVQAPFTSFLATVHGQSQIEERVYPGHRFTHVQELQKMGSQIHLNDSTLSINGGSLEGTKVHAADIRAGGAMVIAGLAATGTTVVTGLEYIERGYASFDERLRQLGATIRRQELVETLTGTYGD